MNAVISASVTAAMVLLLIADDAFALATAGLSLAELLDIDMAVASGGHEFPLRESPGIVSLITADDIRRSGARDLIDVLKMVPGFDIELDILGVLGLGIRGNWANEGKVLVLIDGIDMNDDLYANFEYGHHIPVDLIERIEIIRGPGSALYGGCAELGVISIITKRPERERVFSVTAGTGYMRQTYGRQNLSAFYGSAGENVSYSLAVHGGRGNMSDRNATDLWGTTYRMGSDDNSAKRSFFVNSGITAGNFSMRTVIDRYITDFTYPGEGMSDWTTGFYSYLTRMEYHAPVSGRLVLKPVLQYKYQEPWNTPVAVYDDGSRMHEWEEDITVQKLTAELNADYPFDERNSLNAGCQYILTGARDKRGAGGLGGENNVAYTGMAAFAQGIFATRPVNIAAGIRVGYHDEYGMSYMPRLSLNRMFGDWHMKLLASRALREPSVQNVSYNGDISPELATVYEFETGVLLARKLLLTMNVFNMHIDDVIVYTFDLAGNDNNYLNYGSTGSAGIEFISRYKSLWFDADMSYSFSRVQHNDVDEYKIPGVRGQNLGFPAHKAAASFTFKPFDGVSINISPVYSSGKYAIIAADADDNLYYELLPPALTVDMTALFTNLWLDGFDLSLSVHNVTDENNMFVEPYIGWDWPVSGPSREYSLKLGYDF